MTNDKLNVKEGFLRFRYRNYILKDNEERWRE